MKTYKELCKNSPWNPMDTFPKDREVLVQTFTYGKPNIEKDRWVEKWKTNMVGGARYWMDIPEPIMTPPLELYQELDKINTLIETHNPDDPYWYHRNGSEDNTYYLWLYSIYWIEIDNDGIPKITDIGKEKLNEYREYQKHNTKRN